MNCMQDYYNAVLNGSTLTLAQFMGLWCMGHNVPYTKVVIEVRMLPEVNSIVKHVLNGEFVGNLRPYQETHLEKSELKYLYHADLANVVSLVECSTGQTPSGNEVFIIELIGPAYNGTALLEMLKKELNAQLEAEQVSISFQQLGQSKEIPENE